MCPLSLARWIYDSDNCLPFFGHILCLVFKLIRFALINMNSIILIWFLVLTFYLIFAFRGMNELAYDQVVNRFCEFEFAEAMAFSTKKERLTIIWAMLLLFSRLCNFSVCSVDVLSVLATIVIYFRRLHYGTALTDAFEIS